MVRISNSICKKSIGPFKEGFIFKIRNIDNNLALVYNGDIAHTFIIDSDRNMETPKLYDYFYTDKELRKKKLEKLGI